MLDTHAPSTTDPHSGSTSRPEDAETVQDSFNPHGASIDTSRIIRADYSNPVYTALASQAQERWRSDETLSKHYHECGLAVVGTKGQSGWEYVELSRRNVSRDLDRATGKTTPWRHKNEDLHGGENDVQVLENEEAIKRVLGTDGASGEAGYINWRSGWADAGAAMSAIRRRVAALAHQQQRTLWRCGKAERLLLANTDSKPRVTGVQLSDDTSLDADLTILATGAWTGSLLDLRGRVEATGQVLAYIPLSPSEAQTLENMPVLLNLASGMFAIPPSISSPNPHLKIARHAYGYRNPVTVSNSNSEDSTSRTISLPSSHFSPIPPEAEYACRTFLSTLVPSLANRPFESTRLCWYADTPEGNFVVDYHPEIDGLLLATGGSGHAFKFLPVLGKRIIEVVEGRLEDSLRACWRWPQEKKGFVGTEDGSRGGVKRAVLAEELTRKSRMDGKRNRGLSTL